MSLNEKIRMTNSHNRLLNMFLSFLFNQLFHIFQFRFLLPCFRPQKIITERSALKLWFHNWCFHHYFSYNLQNLRMRNKNTFLNLKDEFVQIRAFSSLENTKSKIRLFKTLQEPINISLDNPKLSRISLIKFRPPADDLVFTLNVKQKQVLQAAPNELKLETEIAPIWKRARAIIFAG